MNRCAIVHGWEGTPSEGWLPWLKAELENRGWEVVAPQMPNAAKPQFEEWLAKLAEVVGEPDENTYFVGHSLGCYTFLKYIERLSENQKILAPLGVSSLRSKIGGGVMVAGFAGHLKHKIPVLEKYYESGLDWDKIRAHDGKYAAIYSERDDYVRVESAFEFQKHLGATLIKNNDWEHFSGSEGITDLPDALSALFEISKK